MDQRPQVHLPRNDLKRVLQRTIPIIMDAFFGIERPAIEAGLERLRIVDRRVGKRCIEIAYTAIEIIRQQPLDKQRIGRMLRCDGCLEIDATTFP